MPFYWLNYIIKKIGYMKVVFGVFSSESASGGVGRVAYEIASAFARQGHQVLLVRPGSSNRKIKINENYEQLLIKSTSEKEIFIPQLNTENIKVIQRQLKDFGPEIVHAHDPGPICFLLQIWANQNNVPFVFTAHVLLTKAVEFGTKEVSGRFGKILDFKLIDKYQELFLKNCDGVVALNKKAEKDLRKFGFKGRIFIIPNGRNLNLYNQCLFAKIKDFKKKLIFVGHLSQRKNQRYLLRVMKYLPLNYSLNLIGGVLNPKYLEELKKYKENHHLKNVKFLGKVRHDRLPRYLAENHLFVSASKMEVQSLAVIEALASGTPVVGLSNETTDELVDDSVGAWLTKKTSPKEFAKTIKKILSLPQKDYERICQNARKKVKHLDWKKVVSQTAKAYLEVVKTKKVKEKPKEKPHILLDLQELFSFFDLDTNQLKGHLPVLSRKYVYLFLLISVSQIANSLLRFSKNIKNLKQKSKKFLTRDIFGDWERK